MTNEYRCTSLTIKSKNIGSVVVIYLASDNIACLACKNDESPVVGHLAYIGSKRIDSQRCSRIECGEGDCANR